MNDLLIRRMLVVLTQSDNSNVKNSAISILMARDIKKAVKNELLVCSLFFVKVLEGNYREAKTLADSDNRELLERFEHRIN